MILNDEFFFSHARGLGEELQVQGFIKEDCNFELLVICLATYLKLLGLECSGEDMVEYRRKHFPELNYLDEL